MLLLTLSNSFRTEELTRAAWGHSSFSHCSTCGFNLIPSRKGRRGAGRSEGASRGVGWAAAQRQLHAWMTGEANYAGPGRPFSRIGPGRLTGGSHLSTCGLSHGLFLLFSFYYTCDGRGQVRAIIWFSLINRYLLNVPSIVRGATPLLAPLVSVAVSCPTDFRLYKLEWHMEYVKFCG